MSSGNQFLLGQYGATNRTCSSSYLILHSVCASRLPGGMHICASPRTSCVPVHLCRALPRIGSRTTGNRLLGFWRCKYVYLSPEPTPNQLDCLGMESPLPRKCRSRQLVGRLIENSWDVDGMKRPQILLTPEEEVTGELRHAT